MPRLVARTVLSALALGATALPAPPATAATPAGNRAPTFVTRCLFSHRLPDDPIVAPGVAGGSHSHDFFGSTTTSAATTPESLLASTTTCRRTDDRSAYWVPSLYMNGVAVKPVSTSVYYRGLTQPHSSITAFPPGLRIIAGNAKATARQPQRVTSWLCRLPGQSIFAVSEPQCPDGAQLILHIGFPDCWDGKRLDSADHKSHMAYSRKMACPATHPVATPAIKMFVVYKSAGGQDVSLASGSALTGHADFFNGWVQDTQSRLVAGCLHASLLCNGMDDPLAPAG